MASKDNQPKEFTTPEGKRYRKTVDKKGKAHYTVFDVNKKTNKFIDAKEFVKENSRYHAKERIRKLKEEADRKKREEEEAKVAAILEAERKVRQAEFERLSMERARKNAERKRIKKEKATLEQAKELSRFLNTVSEENDQVAQMTNKLLDHHDESLRVPYWRGLSKQFLRLSEEFTKLDRKLSDLYVKVSNNKIVSETDIKEFDALVLGSEPLFKKFESLLIDAANRKDVYLRKESEKAKKRKDNKRAERIDAVRKGREEQSKRLEEENRRQTEEAKEKSERDLFEAYDLEKRNRLAKRERSDKFFSTSFEDLSKPTQKLIGASKLLGGVAMAPLNALGLDFRDELDTLGTLFSPFGALGKAGFGFVKNYSQKVQGIDDASIENLENVFTNPGLGKKKKIDVEKVANKLGSGKGAGNSNGKLSSILGALKSFSSNVSNTKNAFNNSSNNQNTSNFTQSVINNRPRVMGGLQSQVVDYNRSDDNLELKQDKRTNELLEEILKELKKDSKVKKTGSGLFSKMGGLGALGKIALPSIAAFTFGQSIGEAADSYFDSKSIQNSSTNNTKEVLLKRLKERNASKEDISLFSNLISQEIDARKINNKEQLNKIQQSKNDILKKYSIKNSNFVRDFSQTNNTSFRNSQNDSTATTMRAEINKIEKINDIKHDPLKIAEDMKKFLVGDFIEKLATAIANKFTEKRDGNKSIMPAMKPF